jgi:hypothetical protein
MAFERLMVVVIVFSIIWILIKYIFYPLFAPYLIILKAKQKTRIAEAELRATKEDAEIIRKNNEANQVLDEDIPKERTTNVRV